MSEGDSAYLTFIKKKDMVIFNPEFVLYNRDRCVLVSDGKEFPLDTRPNKYLFDPFEDKFTFEFRVKKNMIKMTNMFKSSKELISIEGMENWNTSSVISMSRLFAELREMKTLPDISRWDTGNVEDMSSMFSQMNSLVSLPDISGWNTKRVENMSYMFAACTSLYYIPDLSKWDFSNVKDISGMFSHNVLKKLPDISKWNLRSDVNKKNIFYQVDMGGCSVY